MKKFLKKYKVFLLIILLVIPVIFILTRNKASIEPIPTPIPLVFELEQIFPREGKNEIVIPNFAIHFIFSKPISIADTAVKIVPFVDFEISTDESGKTIFVMPVPEWKFNTKYTITVSTKSKDGENLESPIDYQFEPVTLTTSELNESNK